jgi:phospholipid/cholesterol/gamma-HCH transport system substrate-binding protein
MIIMNNYKNNTIKVGLMVTLASLVLILSFYIIGKNRHLFGSNCELKVRFSQLDGLDAGNNVLFSGVQAGTVESLTLINDSTVEVTLSIDEKIQPFIHKNALASIGSAGLIGNKVVNISPGKGESPLVRSGDELGVVKSFDKEQMLTTLSKTNTNLAQISEIVKKTVTRLDSSNIFKIIGDKELGTSIRSTFGYINSASANADNMMRSLNGLVNTIKQGKGTAGKLLSDSSYAVNLRETLVKARSASDDADKLIIKLNLLVDNMNKDLYHGKGSLNTLLQDSIMARNLSASLDNIQKGTDKFNQNMEALKHNFLVRGYFKRQAKQQEKQKADNLNEQTISQNK